MLVVAAAADLIRLLVVQVEPGAAALAAAMVQLVEWLLLILVAEEVVVLLIRVLAGLMQVVLEVQVDQVLSSFEHLDQLRAQQGPQHPLQWVQTRFTLSLAVAQ
jgi:hypothetical protein